MKKHLDTLCSLTKHFLDFRDEKAALDKAEGDAKESLGVAASSGRFDSDRTRQQVDIFSTTLATIRARREHIEKAMVPLLENMRAVLRRADSTWTSIVRANGDKIAANYHKAIAPFYPDGGCPHYETLPLWNNNNRANYHRHVQELNEGNALDMVQTFSALVQDNIGNLDTSLAESK
jgi:hypothetical protein